MKKIFVLIIFVALISIGCEKEDTVAEQLKKDITLIEDYLLENNLTAKSTESGLHYIINEPGTGKAPTNNLYIKVKYVGKLLDGAVFESGEVTLPLYQCIKGWQEALPLFKEEGKGILLIPSKLGYGSKSKPNIPPNSVLIFDVELLDVEK